MVWRIRLRGDDLDWRESEGEILALDRRRGRYFSVSASGALLWTRLAAGTTEDALIALLSERYGIERERASGDVGDFLAWLDDNGLLVR